MYRIFGGRTPDYRGKSFYGQGGETPAGEVYVRIEISSGTQHNDGVTGVVIGNVSGTTWKSGIHSNWNTEGRAIIPFKNLLSVKYLVRAQ